jgi:fumarate hydratase class II
MHADFFTFFTPKRVRLPGTALLLLRNPLKHGPSGISICVHLRFHLVFALAELESAMEYRNEQDSLGIVAVPADAYYGAQTQRARENFPISGLTFAPSFIKALALIKHCAAHINRDLGLLDGTLAEAISAAAREVQEGRHDAQFVLDIFQTGSGTSTNMNANEVIAGRANELLTGKRGGKQPVHPNDHVNLGQSSNDVIPSALHVAALTSIQNRLRPALQELHRSLRSKAEEFAGVMKMGRTHLQDAVPISLGQEFSGYARQIELGIGRIDAVAAALAELALGGTAVGTGLNTDPRFAAAVIAKVAAETACPFREAVNHFEAQGAQDAAVETSGALKTLAVSLAKIANDIRWLASGPRCALGEINLPSLQPGSSIMPGKVNPVIPEAVIQVAAQVIGNDVTIAIGGQGGAFELNTMLPVMAYNLLQSIDILGNAAALLATRCIAAITVNRDRCAAGLEQSLAISTYLVPAIGYDRAAAIAQEAYQTGQTIRAIAMKDRVLPEEELNKLLDAIHHPSGSE